VRTDAAEAVATSAHDNYVALFHVLS
jgi:hypothetical protein